MTPQQGMVLFAFFRGTHNQAGLSDDAIRGLASHIEPGDCVTPKGGVIAMRRLLMHSSSKSVLSIGYASSEVIGDTLRLGIA
jgi:hypothetical protein